MLAIIIVLISGVAILSSLKEKVLSSDVAVSEVNQTYDLHFPDDVHIMKFAPNSIPWNKEYYYRVNYEMEDYFCKFYIRKEGGELHDTVFDIQHLYIGKEDITLKLHGDEQTTSRSIDFSFHHKNTAISGRIFTDYQKNSFDEALLSDMKTIFTSIGLED